MRGFSSLQGINEVTPGQLGLSLRDFAREGLGQMPGITPKGITDIVAVNKRTREKVPAQQLILIDKVLTIGTAAAAEAAIVGFQGGLEEFIKEAEKGYNHYLGWAKAIVSFSYEPAYNLAAKGWDDAIKTAKLWRDYVGGPAHKLKAVLRALPPDAPLNKEAKHEVERQLLGYAKALSGVQSTLAIARDNLSSASSPATLLNIIDETIANLAKVLAWVTKTVLKNVPTLFGAIPWWGWAILGLFAFNAVSPLLRFIPSRSSQN